MPDINQASGISSIIEMINECITYTLKDIAFIENKDAKAIDPQDERITSKELKLFKNYVNELKEHVASIGSTESIFLAMQINQNMQSQLDIIGSLIGNQSIKTQPPANNSRTGTMTFNWFKHIQVMISSISTHLWQLISKYMKLSEWSISGVAGVKLFGLTGNIQVQLTFMP
jgi:hypothetical protein